MKPLDTIHNQIDKVFQNNEELYLTMLESIADHISMIDKELNIIWANKTARKWFGNDIIGKKCYKIFHKSDEPCKPYPCITLKAFQDCKIHEHETKVIDKDSCVRHFHSSANIALRDNENNPTAVIEISRDITDLKLIEEERDKLIKKLQDALENASNLRGLLPICSSCKKVRDDDGYWHQVEVYIRDHSDADFSHSICPDCKKTLYSDVFSDVP